MYIVRMPLTNDFIIAFPFGRAEVYTWRFTRVELPTCICSCLMVFVWRYQDVFRMDHEFIFMANHCIRFSAPKVAVAQGTD
jgi:hypothetical protein